jgi:hypothetical protein
VSLSVWLPVWLPVWRVVCEHTCLMFAAGRVPGGQRPCLLRVCSSQHLGSARQLLAPACTPIVQAPSASWRRLWQPTLALRDVRLRRRRQSVAARRWA